MTHSLIPALLAAMLALSIPAQATVYYQNGNMIIGSDGSVATELGNTTVFTPPMQQFDGQFAPPPTVICTSVGNMVVCN